MNSISDPLQSYGKLTYLSFISLIKGLWEQAHPDIPVKPSAPDEYDLLVDHRYIIVYDLELRKTMMNEPKPKMRLAPNNTNYIYYGQKFQNIIGFTVMAKVDDGQDLDNPHLIEDTSVGCDAIIEEFEDFIFEYTPILKALGVNDLVYSRRLSDSEVMRKNRKVHKRKVTYMLTTEKTFAIEQERLEDVLVMARTKYIENTMPDPKFLGNLDSVKDLPESAPNVGDYYLVDGRTFIWTGFQWVIKTSKTIIQDEFKG
jgi:hypothetical protein